MTKLWKNWTLNCTIGELLGIASAGAIAYLINSVISDPQSLRDKVIILMAMMLAGFIEGLVLSLFQWKVLVLKFNRIPKQEWMFYTILVGVLGWFLGMLPSLFFVPSEIGPQNTANAINFSNPLIFLLLSLTTGAVLGGLFGLFQWFSLRKYALKAYKWIFANAIGWSLGLGWIYLFASIPTDNSTISFIILMGTIGGVFAGLSVGAITGIFLEKLEIKA